MQSIFPQGYKGKSDSIFSGKAGSVLRSIGVDARSEPGKIKVQQALEKVSGKTLYTNYIRSTSDVRMPPARRVWSGTEWVVISSAL